MKSSSSRATYISKTIQNDLIKACGEYIRDIILEELRNCRFFSIIADEVTDSSNSEQLSIVLRFVDDKMNVREEFMGFVECKTGVTGKALAGTILDTLDEWKLDKQNLCGQAYDGASSMAGATRGVAARISQQYPKACLKAKEIKRVVPDTLRRETRCVERHDAFEAFSELFESIVQCLEEIVEPSSRQSWNRADASSHLRALTDFKFIITLTTSKNLLAYIKGLSVKLRGRWQDIVNAYSNIETVLKKLEDVRSKMELFHSRYFDEAKELASKINVEPSIPRRTC